MDLKNQLKKDYKRMSRKMTRIKKAGRKYGDPVLKAYAEESILGTDYYREFLAEREFSIKCNKLSIVILVVVLIMIGVNILCDMKLPVASILVLAYFLLMKAEVSNVRQELLMSEIFAPFITEKSIEEKIAASERANKALKESKDKECRKKK